MGNGIIPNWEKELNPEKDVIVDDSLENQEPAKLVLWNDDVNSFDHVIECLMRILHYSLEQSHQIALIVHTKGKYAIKEGTVSKLKPIYNALIEEKLSAEIM